MMRFVAALSAGQLFFASSAVATTASTNFVNLFIGTLGSGNAFPGSAVPHAMAKVGIDVNTTPRQAGYLSDNSSVSGISLMHDEGTGGNAAGVALAARSALRAPGKDGDFYEEGRIDTFTYPSSSTNNVVVVDLSNDLQRSFHGGSLDITHQGRVKLGGTYMQSYGPDNYTVYGCYDFVNTSNISPVRPVQFGTFQSTNTSQPTSITITPFTTNATLNYPYTSSTNPAQAGALLSFNLSSVTARFGLSFVNPDQACRNAEEEVPTWNWDAVRSASQTKWEDVLERVKVDTTTEDATVVQLLYSSLYRVSLVPANLTGENPYWKSDYPFYDALFCSWDTFRTVHPLLSITSPYEWSEIVNTYIDGWRNTGYIPECRSNTKAGYVQGGSNGMPILGDFIAKYAKHAGDLKVSTDDLYQALVATAENTPPDWYRVGRQNTAWKAFGYIPTGWTDPSGSTGLPTREGSRALEYALGDFAVRQAAKILGKSANDISKYANRSMNFVNHWDPSLTHDGFQGFMQRRYPNGTFSYSPPDACSPVDPVGHSCARGSDNNVGFYESSSWEYSFFAPHSMSTIIKLMGGDQTFLNRVDYYFFKGYFLAGNEPSFQMPWAYHYANRPDLTALRIRNVVYKNFNTGHSGIPGNDDSGAMGALLSFHLLGLYPVVATNQLLISTPFVSSYTITNPLLGTSTTVRVVNFDKKTLTPTPPAGSNIYVQSVTVKGVKRPGICWIQWEDLVGGGEIILELGPNSLTGGCSLTGIDNQRPSSLETGGF